MVEQLRLVLKSFSAIPANRFARISGSRPPGKFSSGGSQVRQESLQRLTSMLVFHIPLKLHSLKPYLHWQRVRKGAESGELYKRRIVYSKQNRILGYTHKHAYFASIRVDIEESHIQ
jgi:hypothetical protein